MRTAPSKIAWSWVFCRETSKGSSRKLLAADFMSENRDSVVFHDETKVQQRHSRFRRESGEVAHHAEDFWATYQSCVIAIVPVRRPKSFEEL